MKKRILVVNEFSGLNTGYSKYGKCLLTELHKTGKYELAELACYLDGRDPRARQFPWRIYPALPPHNNQELMNAYNADQTNQFGKLMFERVCLEFLPTHIIGFRDYWMENWVNQSPYRRFFHRMWMAPVDGLCQDVEWLSSYGETDALFTYQDWSKQVLEDYGLKVDGVPSPIADECFKPMNKDEVKKQLGFENIKIVGMVGRNQARKAIPNLLKCFRQFLEISGRKDIYLYLHTSNRDLGWDLPELIKENGLASKIILTYTCKCGFSFPNLFSDENVKCKRCGKNTGECSNVQNGINDEGLATIYNLMDLYVQHSISEGMGMPQIEAASCGIPIINVRYTAMADVADKLNAESIEPIGYYKEVSTKRLMAVPDDNKLVEALVEFFNLPTSIQRLKGVETRKLFERNYGNWAKTAKVWSDWIDNSEPTIPWNSPPDIRQPIQPQQIPQNISNSEFVKLCVAHVLGQSEKLNSYFALKILRDLNYGFSTSNLNSYMDENSVLFSKPQRQQFGKQEVYNLCLNLRKRINEFETYRTKVTNE